MEDGCYRRGADAMKKTPTVDIHEAQRRLGELVARASKGEEVVLTDGGKPVARLAPIRVAGLHEGAMEMHDDFDASLPASFWVGDE